MDYEKDLEALKEKLLCERYYEYQEFEKFQSLIDSINSNCLHDKCPDCHGTGVKAGGGCCIHHISCSCPKCSQY